MQILNDSKERSLLALALSAFVILCLAEMTTILGSSAREIVSGLCISVVAAYIFYIFIDLIPRARIERNTKHVLDSLLASILDSFNRGRVFGHETPITHVDKSVLIKSWLVENRNKLRDQKTNFLQLEFATQTAHSRLEDFRNSLPLAASLSPECAMQWLIVIDKVRLLAENYGTQPDIPEHQIFLVDTDSDENPVKGYKSTLNFRLQEIVEETIQWQAFSVDKKG